MPIGAAGIAAITPGMENILGTPSEYTFELFNNGVKQGQGKAKLLEDNKIKIISYTSKTNYWTLDGREYSQDPTYEVSNSFDFIYDEASWNRSYNNGGLKKYYVWSDVANAPYKEDLIYIDPVTGETRAARLSDARKDPNTGEYVLDDNGNYIYDNCTRTWNGAVSSSGAKYPWIVPHFNTDVNCKIIFRYEGKEDVRPWGDNVFGIGRKTNGADRLFGCASVAEEFQDNSFLLPENAQSANPSWNTGGSSFDVTKF
jgi:hypothetical protein